MTRRQASTASTVTPRDLEQQKKRAKDLRKALQAGDRAAAERVQRALPSAEGSSVEAILERGVRLHEAQWVIAREAGFQSWPSLKRHIELLRSSEGHAAALWLQAAVAGDAARAEELLAIHPELPRRSIHVAAAWADPVAVRRHLEQRPAAADERGGPHHYSPLLYACSVHLGRSDGQRVEVARALLQAGADPNAYTREMDSLRGHRTCLGAAAGLAGSARLVGLLLEAGANVADGPSLYEGSALWHAVRTRDAGSVQLLLAAAPPDWHIHHALPQALNDGALELVELLLAHGANPNWRMGAWGFGGGCLHEVVARGMSAALLDRVLDAGAELELGDRDGRSAHAWAVRLGHGVLAERLRQRGASDSLTPVDRWAAACFREDALQARALGAELRADMLRPSDHQLLPRALRLERPRAARLLLQRLDPNTADDNGETALHLAARRGDAELVRALLEAGADPSLRDFDGATALSLARAAGRETVVALLAQISGDQGGHGQEVGGTELAAAFEDAADAVVYGDLAALRALLERWPELPRARSPRPHRATLLHYLAANGVEDERQRTPANAVAVMQLLLDAGSDPNASCLTYRGGPDETALGLMLDSHWPREAGLTMRLLRTLARAGARVPAHLAVLADLDDIAAGVEGADEGSVRRRIKADPASAGEALITAASWGERELVRLLLAYGVPVSFVSAQAASASAQGASALHTAAFGGYRDTVELLLAHGADPALRDATFKGTAAGWAQQGGHAELAAYLAAKLAQGDG